MIHETNGMCNDEMQEQVERVYAIAKEIEDAYRCQLVPGQDMVIARHR